jgi:hypothetical protein
MMCNMSYVVCRYSILNGLIDSRELRDCQSTKFSGQGIVDDARLQEVIAQRDAYYQEWFT